MRVASARSVHVSRTRAWPFQAGTQVRRSRRPPSVHWGHDKSLSLGDRDRNRVSLQPDRAQPDREQPDREQPDREQPDRVQPDRAQPDRAQPDRAQPDRAQPDREQPDRGNRLIGVRGISVPGFRLALADATRDRDLR